MSPVPDVLSLELALSPGMVSVTVEGSKKCACTYTWEWMCGLLAKALSLSGDCPLAEQSGQPCRPAPWLPVRVFRLTSAGSTPREKTYCLLARNRISQEAELRQRRAGLRCEMCGREAGPAPWWEAGCASREALSDVEVWSLFFWLSAGKNDLHTGHICPACQAVRDVADREGRSVMVSLSTPRTVSLGECVRTES